MGQPEDLAEANRHGAVTLAEACTSQNPCAQREHMTGAVRFFSRSEKLLAPEVAEAVGNYSVKFWIGSMIRQGVSWQLPISTHARLM